MENKDLKTEVGSVAQQSEPLAGNGAAYGRSSRAPLLGEPGALPLSWCKKCRADVTPEGKGKCPRCGSFIKQNFVARKHPVNVLRRDALLAELEAEFRPTTTLGRSTCAHLAGTLEQLEVLKPGSPEWQRLVTVAQTLGASLDEARSADTRPLTDFDRLPTAELADRAEAIAREFRRLADLEAEGIAYVAAVPVPQPVVATEPEPEAAPVPEAATVALAQAPEDRPPLAGQSDWLLHWRPRQ